MARCKDGGAFPDAGNQGWAARVCGSVAYVTCTGAGVARSVAAERHRVRDENGNMKWKRLIYKDLCNRAEVNLCQACNDCRCCFGPEDASGEGALSSAKRSLTEFAPFPRSPIGARAASKAPRNATCARFES